LREGIVEGAQDEGDTVVVAHIFHQRQDYANLVRARSNQ